MDADEAAAALGERYRIACGKLGPGGAVAAADGRLARAPSRAASGALGAGDAFAAGFLLALAAGAAVADALVGGCESAARRSEHRSVA